MIEDVKSPTNLREARIPKEEIPNLVANALKSKRFLDRQPRILTMNDALELFKEMWEGF